LSVPEYDHPVRFDVLVLGGGTAGCVLAARLSEDPARSVGLVEAGPDYGPASAGHWPADMCDARALPMSHLWEQEPEDRSSSRARIIGGCSAHNACAVVWGSRADYDEWGPGWGFAELGPHLARAQEMLRARSDRAADLTPWHAALLAAAERIGIPRLSDINDLDATAGAAPFPANAVGATRWNTAFAYLDGARARPNLHVLDRTLVDRLRFGPAGRVVGAETDRGPLEADLVVLSAGAYGSAAILLRSGIGPADELARLGVSVVADLPVGVGLCDHPGVGLEWAADERLMPAAPPVYEASVLVRARSAACAPDTWDIQLLPFLVRADETWQATMVAYALKPNSRGRLSLRSSDPREPPHIDHGFLADPADIDVIADGIEVARRIVHATGAPLELRPGASADLPAYVRANVRGIFHPVSTCALGTVVDGRCRVLGVDGVAVVDASIMPTIPRANTNLPVVAIAERAVELLT
jgi:choline dehydrogenase